MKESSQNEQRKLIVGTFDDVQKFAEMLGYKSSHALYYEGGFDRIEYGGAILTHLSGHRSDHYSLVVIIGDQDKAMEDDKAGWLLRNCPEEKILRINPVAKKLYEYRWPALRTKFGKIEASAVASDIETAKAMLIDSWVNSNDDDIAELEESLKTSAAIQTEIVNEVNWDWLR